MCYWRGCRNVWTRAEAARIPVLLPRKLEMRFPARNSWPSSRPRCCVIFTAYRTLGRVREMLESRDPRSSASPRRSLWKIWEYFENFVLRSAKNFYYVDDARLFVFFLLAFLIDMILLVPTISRCIDSTETRFMHTWMSWCQERYGFRFSRFTFSIASR